MQKQIKEIKCILKTRRLYKIYIEKLEEIKKLQSIAKMKKGQDEPVDEYLEELARLDVKINMLKTFVDNTIEPCKIEKTKS